MGTRRVVGIKQYHTMQLATESKAVGKKISDQQMEDDNPESKKPNLRPPPQNCKKVNASSRKIYLTLEHSHSRRS